MTITLHIATKKGAFQLRSEDRENWELSEPMLFGNIIYHMVPDYRDPTTILIATRTGHLGPTIFRSEDGGATWTEAEQPPRFPEKYDRSIDFIFWLTAGHSSKPGVWYAGTSPQGLFVTEDNGRTWESFESFNDNDFIKSIVEGNMGTPIGPLTHSINIDPQNADHLVLALSSGGSFQSYDYGKTWSAFNQNVRADFMPDPYPETGHCVHNMQLHPTNPNIIYQQNHCGVYRIDQQNDDEWTRIGDNLPDEIGDIGFALIVHPTDQERVWVIPMDGSDVWPRTSVDGKPAVYATTDGGQSWSRQDTGLPDRGWFTVLRQASAHDNQEQLGLYFGNRQGEIWASIDEGESWKCIQRYLPDVYSVEVSVEP